MTTTIGMWEMVSELLEGEKLPVSMNEALEGLCNGDLVIAERRELTDQEIYKLWVIHCNDEISVFARAILKKASKK
jgi:hypothetical protein